MRRKNFARRISRRLGAMALAAVMLVTSVTVPAGAEEPGAEEEVLVTEIVPAGTVTERQVTKNDDNKEAEEYMLDDRFFDDGKGDVAEAINAAFADDVSLSVKINVTVDTFTAANESAMIMAYIGDYKNGKGWGQSETKEVTAQGQIIELSIDCSEYTYLSQMGLRLYNCAEGSTAKFTINSAKVIKMAKAGSSDDVGEEVTLVTLEEDQTYTGTAHVDQWSNGKARVTHEFTAPTSMSEETRTVIDTAVKSDEIVKLIAKVQVEECSVTDEEATVRLVAMENYAGENDAAVNWKQDFKPLTGLGIYELSLDFSNYTQFTDKSQLSLEFFGCDAESTVKYTIEYAKVVKLVKTGGSDAPVEPDEPEEVKFPIILEENKTYSEKVQQNPDYLEAVNIRAAHVLTDGLSEAQRNAIDEVLKGDGGIKLEVKVKVNACEILEGQTGIVRLVAMEDYNAGNNNKWFEVPSPMPGTGEYELSIDISHYTKFMERSQISLEFANCKDQSHVDFEVEYARIEKKAPEEHVDNLVARLLGSNQRKKVSVVKNAYADDNYNSHFIHDLKFNLRDDDAGYNISYGLDGFTSLTAKVSITVHDYKATKEIKKKGDEPVVQLYAMNRMYGNWQQHEVELKQKEQKIDLTLDIKKLGYTDLGELGVRFGGCDENSTIDYTVNYAYVVGEGQSNAGKGTLELRYPLTGATKDLELKDTPVGQHGKLSVKQVDGYAAPTIVDKNGEAYQLRGASSHGMAWFPDYINEGAYHTFRDEWGMNMVRIAVYAREGGYTTSDTVAAANDKLIQQGVEAAKKLGMYVMIDWHVLNYNPNEDIEEAKKFFTKYVGLYGDCDNVLFEICNEPTGTPWYDGSGNDLYTYCKEVTGLIRNLGSDAIVICGTNQYSAEVQEVAEKPLSADGFTNVMYTCHFYAASHYEEPQAKLLQAISDGTPVFVTEFGICCASGDGAYDTENADKWLDICDENNISYACWATSNSPESAAYFRKDCEKKDGKWLKEDLTNTGIYLVNRYNDRKNKPVVVVSSIKLSKTEMSLEIGKSEKITASIAPSNATYQAVTWSSSNEAVATVTDGTITAKAAGTATITAKAGARSATCTVTVKKPTVAVTKVTLSKTNATVAKGKTLTLKATVTPSNATDQKVTWKSSNTKVATVKNGKVTAKKAGTAKITATAANGKKATCTITVAAVTLNAKSTVVQVGKSSSAVKVAEKFPKNDTVKSYKSANPKIATVTNKGKVTGKKAGKTTTITVTMKSGATAKFTVKVQKEKVVTKKLTMSAKKLTLLKGKKSTLTVTRNPISATEKLTWSTSNKRVATVNKNGKVTAKAAGTATITVKSANGKRATCKVTVPGVTLKAKTATIKVKETTTIKVKSTVVKGDKVASYKSANKKIATVSGKGKVTGVRAGKTTITVKMKSGATAKFTVIVK